MAVAEFIISAIVNLADEFGFDYSKKILGIIGVGNVGSRLAVFLQVLIDVRFVFPTVNNIGFGWCLLPNILNNHELSYSL
jgi:hypothetical protein